MSINYILITLVSWYLSESWGNDTGGFPVRKAASLPFPV
jgi:hypothetical protein